MKQNITRILLFSLFLGLGPLSSQMCFAMEPAPRKWKTRTRTTLAATASLLRVFYNGVAHVFEDYAPQDEQSPPHNNDNEISSNANTITLSSDSGTPFLISIEELHVLGQLAPTLGSLFADIGGTSSNINLSGISSSTLHILIQMARGNADLHEFVRGLKPKELRKIKKQAEFLDSQALKELISDALRPARLPSIPTKQAQGRFVNLEDQLLNALQSHKEKSGNDFIDDIVEISRTQKKGGTIWFFNLACAPVQDGYLIATRFFYPLNLIRTLSRMKRDDPSFYDPNLKALVKPGNRKESSFEHGSNFPWVNWDNAIGLTGGTLFFKADKAFSEIQLLIPDFSQKVQFWLRSDIRLHNSDSGDIYLMNPRIPQEYLAKVKLDLLCKGIIATEASIKNYAASNNQGMISISEETGSYLYVDWYYTDGIKFIILNKRYDNTYGYDEIVSKFAYAEGFEFDGQGSREDEQHAHRNAGILPELSFGSNHIPGFIGVGHAKIRAKGPYKPGSKIQSFLDFVNGDLKSALGKKLIRHDAYFSRSDGSKSYHYLMYFYYVRFNHQGQPIEMMMSDAFAPLAFSQEGTQEYYFLLSFPMSICASHTDPNECLIGMGEGDYYPAIMSLSIPWIKGLCIHNVRNVDFEKFDYKFFKFSEDGKVEIVDRDIKKLLE